MSDDTCIHTFDFSGNRADCRELIAAARAINFTLSHYNVDGSPNKDMITIRYKSGWWKSYVVFSSMSENSMKALYNTKDCMGVSGIDGYA